MVAGYNSSLVIIVGLVIWIPVGIMIVFEIVNREVFHGISFLGLIMAFSVELPVSECSENLPHAGGTF